MTQNNYRFFNFEQLNKEVVQAIFYNYNRGLIVQDIAPIATGMSTSNYKVEAGNSKFLLKVYPKNNDHSDIEIAAYNHGHKIINVPKVLYFDNSKTIINNSYAIFQYIEGYTLKEYVFNNKGFPNNVPYKIGSMLGLLHGKEYEVTALLNSDLTIKSENIPFKNQFEFYLKGTSGNYLSKTVKEALEQFINSNPSIIERISERNVLCHGDFIPSNILIDHEDTPWFIDFEYCLSMPCYYDIGKIFRSSRSFSQYIDHNTRRDFAEGYNSTSKRTLPEDWYRLSKIADIVVMLMLINRDNIPNHWIEEIEKEIMATLKFT